MMSITDLVEFTYFDSRKEVNYAVFPIVTTYYIEYVGKTSNGTNHSGVFSTMNEALFNSLKQYINERRSF